MSAITYNNMTEHSHMEAYEWHRVLVSLMKSGVRMLEFIK